MQGTISLTCDGVAGTVAFQQSRQMTNFRLPRQNAPGLNAFSEILTGVPPGQYTLRIVGAVGSNAFGATAPVEVNGSDLTVNLDIKPLSRIDGTIHLPPGVVAAVPVTVSLRGAVSGAVRTVTARSDGGFNFPAVEPGRFNGPVAIPEATTASSLREWTQPMEPSETAFSKCPTTLPLRFP